MTKNDAVQVQELQAALARSELRQQELLYQLKVQQGRLEEAQAVANMGSWETDLETLQTTWSLQTHLIFATDPETFRPSHGSFLEFVHPEDRQAVDEAFQLSHSKSTLCVIEHRVRLRDGKLKTVEERWQTFFDEAGRAVRAVGTCQEISQRKTAQEDLLRNGRLLRIAGRFARMGGWEVNLETGTVLWSDETCLIHELPLGTTPTLEEALEFYPPEYQAQVRRLVQACIAEGHGLDFEAELITAKGKRVWVRVVGEAVRDAQDKVVSLQGAFQDLSERKRTEARLAEQAALIDQASDAIVVSDLEHRIHFWSQGAQRIYGWTSQAVTGRQRQDLLKADPEVFARADREVRENGEWSGEIQKRSRSGNLLTVDARWTLLRDQQGQPRSILSLESDITQRKLLEQQFLRAQRLESIGTLAGGIAHDLNNMLTPIIMAVEMLKADSVDPYVCELLEVVGTSAQRGADMVRQVLSFARGLEGQRMEVQLRHILRETEQFTRETFGKAISVQVHLPENLWTVLGDPTQLHQVLVNLCVNARDAMEKGGELKISAENLLLDDHYAGLNPEATPGPYVVIQVADSGSGIAPHILEKIFDPFFTTKDVGKGTGLGLSTSLAIAKSHGGFLRVLSQPAQGTTFKLFLPASPETSAQQPDQLQSPSLLPRGRGELILVVDDEDAVRQVTGRTLEAFGYRVLLAADGAEALGAYAEHVGEISAVITDMRMPLFDGAATIEVLRRLEPDLPVIVVSGLTSPEQEEKLARLGVVHFLPKPFTAEPMLRALHTLLEGQT